MRGHGAARAGAFAELTYRCVLIWQHRPCDKALQHDTHGAISTALDYCGTVIGGRARGRGGGTAMARG